MPTLGDETARLRQLHDDYTWELNAAVTEGREDLIAGLIDDYLADALHEMELTRLPGQGFDQDTIRVRPHARSAMRRHHWWRLHRH